MPQGRGKPGIRDIFVERFDFPRTEIRRNQALAVRTIRGPHEWADGETACMSVAATAPLGERRCRRRMRVTVREGIIVR